MDQRKRIRGSCLCTPATSLDMMRRALASEADAVVFDLEDSVHADGKAAARQNVIEMAPRQGDTARLAIRVNGWATQWCYRELVDVLEAVGDHIGYVDLPKANSPSEVAAVAGLIGQIERSVGIGHRILFEPLIESVTGLDARAILGAERPHVLRGLLGNGSNVESS